MIETFTDQGSEYFFANTPEENVKLLTLADSLGIPIVDDDMHELRELCFKSHGSPELGTWKPYACLVVEQGKRELECIRHEAIQI